jgi:hypothetical protein
MKHIKLFEQMGAEVAYIISTDDSTIGSNGKLTTWSLRAKSKEEALMILHLACGGDESTVNLDSWERPLIQSVEDLINDLNGKNGRWTYFSIDPVLVEYGLNQIPSGSSL